jgi:hypothetical protein
MLPYFLNVDLEIESASKLDTLAAALGERVHVLYSGPVSKRRRLLALESSGQYKNADETIHALCAVVESLSPAVHRVWSAATRKEFDIGYELRASEFSSRFTLRTDTLERMVRLGATLAVTCYRGEGDDASQAFQEWGDSRASSEQ